MTDLWSYLKTVSKPIVLYGMGNGADKTVARLQADGVKISGVFSSSGFKKNKLYAGHTVKDYESLKNELGDMIILVCFGSHLSEVIDNVKKLVDENELYMPDVPVAGEVIFDIEFARNHKEQLKTVYEKLADSHSKKVFENTVMFKLTGKPEYLFKIETGRDEVFDILKLTDNEVFWDLGAYNGDTVAEFVDNVKTYSSIVAVEPDKRNFKKLIENTSRLGDIKCINAAISDKKGIQLMAANHGRGNSTDKNKVEVETISLKEISDIAFPTYIKMDIEGNESKAIDGGVTAIKQFLPKMHIACYHTPFDIFEIPLKILNDAPDYKIYMRHHPCFPAWDINYIFIK